MHRRAQNPLENCETKEDMVTAADKPDPTSVGLPTPQQVTKRTKMKKLTTKTMAFNNYGRYKERKIEGGNDLFHRRREHAPRCGETRINDRRETTDALCKALPIVTKGNLESGNIVPCRRTERPLKYTAPRRGVKLRKWPGRSYRGIAQEKT